MPPLELYYVTNRKHYGAHRWQPEGYTSDYSTDGLDNLRFGKLQVEPHPQTLDLYLGEHGSLDGEGLGKYLSGLAGKAWIKAYEEKLEKDIPEPLQPDRVLGSLTMFKDLHTEMTAGSDVLVYVHGYGTDWADSVGAALALQAMLNRQPCERGAPVKVVLFSWPSDGSNLYTAYRSDREDARASSVAFARAFLKLRDFLITLRPADKAKPGMLVACGRSIHLLCHSMGNWLLEQSLDHVDQNNPGRVLPRGFDHIFLCAPDVDDDALEPGRPLARLPEIASGITLYHNAADAALWLSDATKGNKDRLGATGAARPNGLHQKINQVDCGDVAKGLTGHSYYLSERVIRDIRHAMAGVPPVAQMRQLERRPAGHNVWWMQP